MKKIINSPESVVAEMLAGMEAAHSDMLKKLENLHVMVRSDAPKEGKVALVSGGGSGHEPSHAGFVGKGMLDAAVAGDVFTSPTPDQIFEAIKAVDGGKGVLLIIKNYTGDVMNFDMAKEMAEVEGIKVESVVVNDDVAIEDKSSRRGVAGTVLVHKIAGALAESGADLEAVKKVAEKTIQNMRSMGVALTPCVVPAAGKPTFTLAEDEIELGIGIHGEPGTCREKILKSDEIVDHLLDKIIRDLPFKSGDEVVAMVNGMGATPLMELYIMNKRVREVLKEKGIKICKSIVGDYMTSLEMMGASITLLKVDEDLKELLNSPAKTPALTVV